MTSPDDNSAQWIWIITISSEGSSLEEVNAQAMDENSSPEEERVD